VSAIKRMLEQQEYIAELEAKVAQLITVLRSYPCRCQMQGGIRWHLQAQMVVKRKCSKCRTLELYNNEVAV
jgi:hypothetical protein